MRITLPPSVLNLGAEDRIDLGGGIKGPPAFEFSWEPDGSPHDIAGVVKIKLVPQDGRYSATELTVSGKVTSETLHAIPVQQIIRGAVLAAVTKLEPVGDGSFNVRGGIMGSEWVDPDVAKNGPTDEALQAVATIYRLAYAAGDPPTKAVATVLHLAESTAARWVGKARQAGHLGPTKKGKAGA